MSNWKKRYKQRQQRNVQVAARENSDESVRRRGGSDLQSPKTKAELFEETVVKAREARRLGEECLCVLVAYGANRPEMWSARELRELIATLRKQGDVHDAWAVERYADARVAWGQSINAQNSTKATTRKPEKEAAPPPKAPEPVHIDPVTSQAIPLRLVGKRAQTPTPSVAGTWQTTKWAGSGSIPENPPEWHRSVPPWEDGPAGAETVNAR